MPCQPSIASPTSQRLAFVAGKPQTPHRHSQQTHKPNRTTTRTQRTPCLMPCQPSIASPTSQRLAFVAGKPQQHRHSASLTHTKATRAPDPMRAPPLPHLHRLRLCRLWAGGARPSALLTLTHARPTLCARPHCRAHTA